jgi:hypothetical protein
LTVVFLFPHGRRKTHGPLWNLCGWYFMLGSVVAFVIARVLVLSPLIAGKVKRVA